MAQVRYYQDQVGVGQPAWAELLRGPTELLPMQDTEEHDDISIQSAPVDHSSPQEGTWRISHQRTQSSCLPSSRPVSTPSTSRMLTATQSASPPTKQFTPVSRSSSAYSGSSRTLAPSPRSSLSNSPSMISYMSNHSSNPSLLGSQPSLIPPSPTPTRPLSLYVPFVGCVDTPRPPPGQAAREILNAMSYAPTQDSYSPGPRSPPVSPRPRSRNNKPLPLIPQSPRLKSKSTSLASLLGSSSPRPSYHQYDLAPLSRSSSSLQNRTGSPVPAYTSSPIPPLSPLLSPSNPINHSENSALKLTHPPVIHPPPDLVQMTSRDSIQSSPGMFHNSSHDVQTAPLESIKETSPYRASP